VIKRNLTIN